VEARYATRRELLVLNTGAGTLSLLDLWAGTAGGGGLPRWEQGGGVARDWKTEAEEKQEKADLMRGSMEVVAVARDVALSSPSTASLDMMRYVNPESNFSCRCRRRRRCCNDLFHVPSVLAPHCFPLRSRRYLALLTIVSFFVVELNASRGGKDLSSGRHFGNSAWIRRGRFLNTRLGRLTVRF
jgi:hypothetical protein